MGIFVKRSNDPLSYNLSLQPRPPLSTMERDLKKCNVLEKKGRVQCVEEKQVMAKTAKVIYKCTHVKKKVCLDVESETEKAFLGQKIVAQTVLKCDLLAMGGCNMRLDRFDTQCPAVAQAGKCGLK
jgi:hypothetical protein